MDILAASDRLSRIELSFDLDGLRVHVLWFRAMRNEGEWLIRRHVHSSYEFHLVAAGSCRVTHAGGEFTAHAGQFYLTGPHVWHEQASTGGEYVEYCLNCDIAACREPDADGRAMLESFVRAGCRPVADMGGIDCFARALGEADGQKTGYYSMVRSLAAMILTLAARAFDGGRASGRAPMWAEPDDVRFRQIEQFVRDNVGGPIADGDLAAFLYISTRQLGRIMRRQTGRSTQQYVRWVKLGMARQMLRGTDAGIGEIAARLGFASIYYFSQFFKREEGCSPTEFRHNVRNT